MGNRRRLAYWRRYKMPTPWQAVCFFAVLFTFFLLVWIIQWLGYWPDSWTVNPELGPE